MSKNGGYHPASPPQCVPLGGLNAVGWILFGGSDAVEELIPAPQQHLTLHAVHPGGGAGGNTTLLGYLIMSNGGWQPGYHHTQEANMYRSLPSLQLLSIDACEVRTSQMSPQPSRKDHPEQKQPD